MSDRFNEGLTSLEDKAIVLSSEEEEKLVDLFEKSFPFAGSKIDWQKVSNLFKKIESEDMRDILAFLEKWCLIVAPIYVISYDANDSVLRTDMKTLLDASDNLQIPLKPLLHGWIFCPDENYVIEYNHPTKTVGILRN